MTARAALLRRLPRLAAVLAALVGAALPDAPAVQGPVAACPEGESEPGADVLDADLVVPPSPVRSGGSVQSERGLGSIGVSPTRPPTSFRTDPFRNTPSDLTSTGRGVRLRC